MIPLLLIVDALSDSMMMTGSDSTMGSLSFYTSTKNAADMNIPKARTIYNDLSTRFSGRPKKLENKTDK